MDPNIRITEVVSDSLAVFLDLMVFKGPDFETTGVLSTCVFQKEMNLYQYLPLHSAHPARVFSNLVSGELRRYLALCSDLASFCDISTKFYSRLLRRGYNSPLIDPIFKRYPFSRRPAILEKLSLRSPAPVPIVPVFNLIVPYSAFTRDVNSPSVFSKTSVSDFLPAQRMVQIRWVYRLPPSLFRIFSKFPSDGPSPPALAKAHHIDHLSL